MNRQTSASPQAGSSRVVPDPSWTTFQTSDPQTAREFAARTFGGRGLVLVPGRVRFDFAVRSRHLGLFGVDLVRCAGHLETTRGRGDHAYVVEVLAGALTARSATAEVTVGPGQAMMTSGDEERTVTWDDVRLVAVQLDELELRNLAMELADIDLTSHRFRLGGVVSQEHARQWSAVVRYVIQGVLENPVAVSSPIAQREAFRLLATTALEAFHQVDFSADRLNGTDASPQPATIRRAIEFIEANAQKPIGVQDVACAARLSVRGTQAAFRRHLGTSPTAYLREVRLAGAHRDLVAADATAGESVADIAVQWGFIHLGHFAASYRARYGVSPSHTLAQ